ncbi:response regulator transcription factor [Aliidiomarina soli]|uniref:DNA-binding response regulator n=1 Tax=Aliidiomarina soli TaxID=1928574 RepID=A0A432WJA4_9GAMM|nr:response regulator transcription factor [Aliidiomarina soli]RUO33787.1 DNA-binding response regulator [Aliidiomarina soli]
MNGQILVIDDEAKIRRLLSITLQSENYSVVEADSGNSGIKLAARYQPEAILLDLGLPDMDGQEVLLKLREFTDVPILILSVRDADAEKIKGLDNGAQDYVTKPFSVEELLARLRGCLRDYRKKNDVVTEIDDGNLYINFASREVIIHGEPVELTPKEYAVLSLLARLRNRVVTQEQILKMIWGETHIHDTHYLRIVISHLRQKLGDSPTIPRYILTDPGVGYRLIFAQ